MKTTHVTRDELAIEPVDEITRAQPIGPTARQVDWLPFVCACARGAQSIDAVLLFGQLVVRCGGGGGGDGGGLLIDLADTKIHLCFGHIASSLRVAATTH